MDDHIIYGSFNYFIHILKIHFKIMTGQPTKNDFIFFERFELEIVLKFTKLHNL